MLLFQLRLGVKLLLMFARLSILARLPLFPFGMNVLVEVIPIAMAASGWTFCAKGIVTVEVGTVDDGLLPVGEIVIEVAAVDVGKSRLKLLFWKP